jgi:hypothetical protein
MDIPPSPDMSRPVATGGNTDYTLSLEEVSERYARAGHPRTLRSLQRYCVSGHLDAQKVATALGDKYLVTPQSVARHIAQIEELAALDTVATGRGMSRHVATPVGQQVSAEIREHPHTTTPDQQRQAAAGDGEASHHVARLEREVEQLHDDRDFLREQIKVKDGQIASLLERDRETNVLIRGLQQMLTPLLGRPAREQSAEDREPAWNEGEARL